MTSTPSRRRVGVAVVGLGGAVATTAAAGIVLLERGAVGTDGLPLAHLPAELTDALPAYADLVFGGWDVHGVDLAAAAREHDVLTLAQYDAAADALAAVTPWPAVANEAFCRNVTGAHVRACTDHRAAVAAVRADLRRFREERALDGLVVVNLASTEGAVDRTAPIYADRDAFEQALDASDPGISPAMLYAYGAIAEGVPYVNFTPSAGADLPALIAFAEERGVPVCGRDGKTGQTFLKTVIAPGLAARALRVDGWFSTNILGNRDGRALQDRESLASKLTTKGSVLDQILGYHVEDHIVDIHFYRPRGDAKEAWDNVDLIGFLGQKMQVKINFLCKDSILAAPLVIELARLADAAQRRGEGGVMTAFSTFFKSPMTRTADEVPEHALHRQHQMLLDWLATASPDATAGDGAADRSVPAVAPER